MEGCERRYTIPDPAADGDSKTGYWQGNPSPVNPPHSAIALVGKGGRIEKIEFEQYDPWPDRHEWLLARIRVWLVGRPEPRDYGLPLALAWEGENAEKLPFCRRRRGLTHAGKRIAKRRGTLPRN